MENVQTEQEIRELVEQAAGGSREAIASLLKAYTSDMYFVTRLYVGDKETAKSSEQTALRSALRNLKDSASAESFGDWLTDIVRNTALNNIPEISVSSDSDLKYTNKDEIPDTKIQLPADADECKIRILHALDSLPSSERAAAALRYYDLLSLDEISEKLNVSKDDTRKLLASAKKILADSDTGVSALLALASKVNPKLSFDEDAAQSSEDGVMEADDLELDDLFEITAAAEKLNDVDLSFDEGDEEEPQEED
ncbi:MAG: sigma-70 family RNA polymerase sigma factor, partial [Erysipelotrichaceae bacterium]|nr:sigma-70 family RNA polymerase sigma factor [Erysipelotrichaceae bacterium]